MTGSPVMCIIIFLQMAFCSVFVWNANAGLEQSGTVT